MDHKIQLDVFEGPLDLLLYLVKKEEVDIYEVNLTKIATQFVEYVDAMRQLDLDLAGEFLVMAATLMYIKSRELLPIDQQVPADEEDEDDPRWELIRQLVEYKKFKDAAAQLQQKELVQEQIYPRNPGKIEFASDPAAPRPEVGLLDLINAVNVVLKRFHDRIGATRDVFEDKWTVTQKIEQLLLQMAGRDSVRFSDLFAETTSRSEVVVTFLALLELIRLKKLRAIQSEPFSEIEIIPAAETAPADLPAESANGSSPEPPEPEQWN